MSSLFDKLKEGMDKVATGAQDKIHEAQLRAQLRTIEREKADQLSVLGGALYAMHQSGEIHLEALHGQFQALDATEARLEEKQKEIDEAIASGGASAQPAGTPGAGTAGAGERHCQCGAVLSPAARFCPECGQANPAEPV